MVKRRPRAPKDDLANKAEPSEFNRFEQLTKKLVAVPKDEIDKARERDKAKRNR